MTKTKGFTLVECLVVICIVVVLVGLLLPAIMACMNASNNVVPQTPSQAFKTNHGTYYVTEYEHGTHKFLIFKNGNCSDIEVVEITEELE